MSPVQSGSLGVSHKNSLAFVITIRAGGVTNQSVPCNSVIFCEVSQFQHKLCALCHSLLSGVQVCICSRLQILKKRKRWFVFFIQTCSILPLRRRTNATGSGRNSHNASSLYRIPRAKKTFVICLGNRTNNSANSGQHTRTECLQHVKYFSYIII